MLFLYLLLLLIQATPAEEITLHYTTDLSDQPSLWIEHQGNLRNVPLKRDRNSEKLHTWQGNWTQEDALFFQIHLQHENDLHSVSTVQFGKKNPQIVNILNDTQNHQQQFVSGKGSVDEISALEEHWFFKRWIWLVGLAFSLLFLKGVSSKPLRSLPSFLR